MSEKDSPKGGNASPWQAESNFLLLTKEGTVPSEKGSSSGLLSPRALEICSWERREISSQGFQETGQGWPCSAATSVSEYLIFHNFHILPEATLNSSM